VTSGIISLVAADGGNRRDRVLTYTPSRAYAEDRYYAQPVWAADGTALGVAIPPVDPYAQPTQHTGVWHIPADGTLRRLVAHIPAAPMGQIAFSPDLAHVAYLQQVEGSSTQANLLVTELSSGETMVYYPKAIGIQEWAPDAQHFAFMPLPPDPQQPAELPQAQIGQLGSDPIPIDTDPDLFVGDLRWIDATRYLILAKDVTQDTWKILLGGIGVPSVILASIPERPGDDVPPYDFAKTRASAAHPGT